jgi:hypothetical protein
MKKIELTLKDKMILRKLGEMEFLNNFLRFVKLFYKKNYRKCINKKNLKYFIESAKGINSSMEWVNLLNTCPEPRRYYWEGFLNEYHNLLFILNNYPTDEFWSWFDWNISLKKINKLKK